MHAYSAKLINISRKEGTKKGKALSANAVMLEKNRVELINVEEKGHNEKNKD